MDGILIVGHMLMGDVLHVKWLACIGVQGGNDTAVTTEVGRIYIDNAVPFDLWVLPIDRHVLQEAFNG